MTKTYKECYYCQCREVVIDFVISAISLQEKLINNVDDLVEILINLGFREDKIKFHALQNLITSTRPEEGSDNENGFLLYTNSLRYMYTTRSGQGNIFSLVMDLKGVNFPKALELICGWIGFNADKITINLPFGGFYKQVVKASKEPEQILKEYNDNDLPACDSFSQQFFKDGIGFTTQAEWGVRFNHIDNNTLIPIHDFSGRLVGCKARNNDDNCSMNNRWYAYLPYAKTAVLYGFHKNYKCIQEKRTVFIFESEKSVLQCSSFSCNVALAIGGHTISKIQAKYIISLMADKYVIAFDADIKEDELRFEAEKLKTGQILKPHIGYIYDKEHDVLKEKASPSDYGRNVFSGLAKSFTKWVT